MARIDDYQHARDLAAEALARESLAAISRRSGFGEADGGLAVPFLTRRYRVDYPSFDFSDVADAAAEVPLQEQVLILHYLLGAEAGLPSQDWAAYREIPGASFYYSAFVKRAIAPLKKVFGGNVAAFRKAATALGGQAITAGDAGFELRVLPQVALQLILWEGDEEFGAEANILFNPGIQGRLSPEDIAWLAGMVVYRMMALSR
ncbi:MAG TPA: DUF3786 domain-containing protein [Desulfobacterales bacterium]|nr:DUF3786 domain-containing protein [Desulfobacterales bacterium]